jgi:hypothetical protein
MYENSWHEEVAKAKRQGGGKDEAVAACVTGEREHAEPRDLD